MRLRIATFNIENLAARQSFQLRRRPEMQMALSLFDVQDPEARETVQRSVAITLEDDKRELTALSIAETRADLLILQEVDNLGVLQPFFANYVHRLSDHRYGHFRLVDGNDPRGIDVAFAARLDLFQEKRQVKARSHHERTFEDLQVFTPELEQFGIKPTDLLFNRDCLEVTLDFGHAELVLFICHFKAISDREDGRHLTRPLRQAEARAVRRIVQERFADGWREANWIVAGDLNDFVEMIRPGGVVEPALPSGLDPLFEDFAVNPVAALPPNERWTFYYCPPGQGGAPRSKPSGPLHRVFGEPRRPLPRDRLRPPQGERPLPAGDGIEHPGTAAEGRRERIGRLGSARFSRPDSRCPAASTPWTSSRATRSPAIRSP
jgi:endonuclease/exonuclease/phosphatase family metal-dependent hydrolase